MAAPETSRVYRFADLPVHSPRALPELLEGDAGTADAPVRLTWGTARVEPVAEWFHQWGDDPVWARFGATGSGYVVEFPGLAVFTLNGAATALEIAVAPGVPDFTARHLLLNQVLPLVLSHRGRMVLHAGAVVIDGRVTAFVGTTGSGKSTLVAACAAAGADVMTDDSLVVQPDSSTPTGWRAVPAYPSVRLWPDALPHLGLTAGPGAAAHYTEKHRFGPDTSPWTFATTPHPLARILLLDTPDEARRPAALDVFAQVFRLDIRDSSDAVRLFHAVADLARDVPVVRVDDAVGVRDPRALAQQLVAGGPVAARAGIRA
jgi:energy-coupling factor transporter ATP-binding protein EcfA2